jgi:hypothetical protein
MSPSRPQQVSGGSAGLHVSLSCLACICRHRIITVRAIPRSPRATCTAHISTPTTCPVIASVHVTFTASASQRGFCGVACESLSLGLYLSSPQSSQSGPSQGPQELHAQRTFLRAQPAQSLPQSTSPSRPQQVSGGSAGLHVSHSRLACVCRHRNHRSLGYPETPKSHMHSAHL